MDFLTVIMDFSIRKDEISLYTAYLVDDELLVLEDMINSIAWEEHDIMVVGSCTIPEKAIEDIARHRPDVVFTDIKMPGTDGFELISKLQEMELDCEFVVVSAFESFVYARRLIQLGGFDYLIKPVEEKQYTELFNRLLINFEKNRPHRNLPNTESSDLNQVLLYLNRNISKKYTLSEISSKFNFSVNQICNLFSKHLNTTYSSYTTKIRMENAKRLLTSTDKSIKEISMDCGYDDYFYFCRVFRGYYSCTPTQLRDEADKY